MSQSAIPAWPYALLLSAVAACSDDSNSPPPVSSPLDSGLSYNLDANVTTPASDGGLALVPNGDQPDPGAGALYLTASGEALAVTGYDFPPASPDDTFLVDGWVFHLTHEIVTFDHVQIWEDPDLVPADQSAHGALVAHLDGPWAVDLHQGGPLAGEGGGAERAQPFAAIKKRDDGSPFDTTRRYAFGYEIVTASDKARNVNLDADGLAQYESMIAQGYTVLYVGSVSRPANDTCATVGGSNYDFDTLPKSLPFRLGFRTPTSYVNCQNGSAFQGVPGINGEDSLRGVQFRSDRSIIAQLTAHADHPFWESFAEDSALRFDQIAAQFVGVPSPVATTEAMQGVDFSAFTDKAGKALPMRSCVDSSLYVPAYALGQQLHFDPLKVPVDKHAQDPATALRDYYDYMQYTQSTFGHLNSQGLCFISRNFPAPPGGS